MPLVWPADPAGAETRRSIRHAPSRLDCVIEEQPLAVRAQDCELSASDLVVPIRAEIDVIIARHRARELASELGFSSSELTAIATAISEVARNIVIYSGTGEIVLRIVEQERRRE